jgi:hypothetical protein
MVALSRPRSMLIIIGNITDLEANNKNARHQRSIIWKLIEHFKRHHFCVDITDQLAEAWQAEFTTAEDLGEKRIHYVRNNAMATQFAFKPAQQVPFNVENIGCPGPADADFHPSSHTMSWADEPMDTLEGHKDNDEEGSWNKGGSDWNADTYESASGW